jgi:hypothetical protein
MPILFNLYQLLRHLFACLHLLKHHCHRFMFLLLNLLLLIFRNIILLWLDDLFTNLKARACSISTSRHWWTVVLRHVLPRNWYLLILIKDACIERTKNVSHVRVVSLFVIQTSLVYYEADISLRMIDHFSFLLDFVKFWQRLSLGLW